MQTIVAQNVKYNNPIAEQRADPFIYKDTDVTYYFIATNPEFDRIGIRSAKTINGLKGHPLGDPNRHARVRVLQWTKNGFPNFGQKEGD